MPDHAVQWVLQDPIQPPPEFLQAVRSHGSELDGRAIAQILWQRGIQNLEQLAGYLNPARYQPVSPFEFGQEMHWAMQRLQQAYNQQELVAIWGDFDADGVTATSVLWDGLGQFFQPQKTLVYFIPNRLVDSHGLSLHGLDALHQQDCRLIVTCDTGSTNLAELAHAQYLGIDVIVTDHHTLPDSRPPVVSIINPRSLPKTHPLASLSGVAVAYKLVEALYATLPKVPRKPLHELLDLVAIGLIADLVELKGDCRYLAQRGIEQLQKQTNPTTMTRPGVAKLLELCKRTGDRPTDISFGLGPRINAVSRIQGDAQFCVELLTSQDQQRCAHLAEATELANTRRKALQKEVVNQVRDRLAQRDLSTTSVIVLADDQWQPGVLGLVAGQIAQDYGKPTILLSMETGQEAGKAGEAEGRGQKAEEAWEAGDFFAFQSMASSLGIRGSWLARGSARSVHKIDLYQLVKGQEHLLHRFGGHPFAAGLSLPVENIPLFTEAINQELRRSPDLNAVPTLQIDLCVTVGELGKALFQELKLLEPCGMGNPAPKLLIQNCWFANVRHKNLKDRRGQKVQYIKTEFELWDESIEQPFPGIWWGHYKDEVPQGRCDVVVELDSNTYDRRYEVRLIAVRPCETVVPQATFDDTWILDWRQGSGQRAAGSGHEARETHPQALCVSACPTSWAEFQAWWRRSQQEQRPLAIAYSPPTLTPPLDSWRRLVGVAKYLSRTGQLATRQQLLEKLDISDRSLFYGLQSLTQLGFEIDSQDQAWRISWNPAPEIASDEHPDEPSNGSSDRLAIAVEQFLAAIQEEHFYRQFFSSLPIATIRAVLLQNPSDLRDVP
jgi:single-stranded-DNA-specific exonuclease